MDKHWENLSENLKLSDESRERIRAQLATRPIHQEDISMKKKTSKLRFGIAFAAAMSLLTLTAFALFPSLRELIRLDLGPKAPYATEVLGSCEDQGITITAQSALTDGRMTRLYFTIHDPSGLFFLEDTDHNLYMDFLSGDEKVWGTGGTELERLSYDPETQMGLYVYSEGTYREYSTDTIPCPTHAKLTMTNFTPGQRYAGATFFGPADGNCNLPLAPLECVKIGDRVVLLPEQNPCGMGAEEVAISSMGFGEDGCYHIRLTQQPQVTSIYSDCPFGVNYWMNDPDDTQAPFEDCGKDVTVAAVPGGWDLCLPSLTEERKELLQILSVKAMYSVSGGRREGEWSLSVPIQAAEGQEVIPDEAVVLSRTKDSPPPSGRPDEAQVAEIFLSPLGVTVDFVTPEGHDFPCSINGDKTECIVTLTDGSQVTPRYGGETWHNRRGWIAWEFEQPITPEQVASIFLNGNEIPLN